MHIQTWKLGVVALAFCGCTPHDKDIRQFVSDSGKAVSRTVEPLPVLKPLARATYEGFDIPDPFTSRRIKRRYGDSTLDINPHFHQGKEALEQLPLEQLVMVGTISRGMDTFALVRANKLVYKVGIGNHVGLDMGRVVALSANSITIKEFVRDSQDDWAERQSILMLRESENGKAHGGPN